VSQKAPSITKTNSPLPEFESQEQLSTLQPAPSERSVDASSDQMQDQTPRQLGMSFHNILNLFKYFEWLKIM